MSRIAVSIVLEAAPFLLLGSLLSATVNRYVDTERLAHRVPKGPMGRIAVGLIGGLIMPICECGSVSLTRRLLEKGVPPLTAVTYMLSAPVINPIVLISTYVAFGGNLRIVMARALIVACSAAFTGWICDSRLCAARLGDSMRPAAPPIDHHLRCHGDGRDSVEEARRRGVLNFFSGAASEFLDMGKYLILGALASAAFKAFLPWQHVQALAGSASLSIAALMLMAVLLCVCSEADAFVAASFVYVPPAAQVGFMTLGAMVDLKLVGMYFSVFPKKTAWILITAPAGCVFGLTNLLSFLMS